MSGWSGRSAEIVPPSSVCRRTDLVPTRAYQVLVCPSTWRGRASGSAWHQLEVQQVSGDTWAAYLDGAEEATYSMGASYDQLAQAGMEYHYSAYITLTGDAYFSYSYNEVRQASSTSWEYWPSSQPLVENPTIFNWYWTQNYIHGYGQ